VTLVDLNDLEDGQRIFASLSNFKPEQEGDLELNKGTIDWYD